MKSFQNQTLDLSSKAIDSLRDAANFIMSKLDGKKISQQN